MNGDDYGITFSINELPYNNNVIQFNLKNDPAIVFNIIEAAIPEIPDLNDIMRKSEYDKNRDNIIDVTDGGEF